MISKLLIFRLLSECCNNAYHSYILLPHTFYFIMLAMPKHHAVHVCVCVCVLMYMLCVHVCMYVHAYMHPRTHIHARTYTHTYRHDQLKFL